MAYCTTISAQTDIVQKISAPPTACNFAYPQSVFVDSHRGHIWVTDFSNNRVLRFDVSTLTSLDELQYSAYPEDYFLGQNYPNPFNPSTKIRWHSPVGSWQSLKVYDVLGNEVATLADEYKPAGSYEIDFSISLIGNRTASGIYFYQLKTGDFIQTKKMVLVK